MPRSIHYSFFKASQPIPFFFIVWLMCVLYITAYTTPSNDNAICPSLDGWKSYILPERYGICATMDSFATKVFSRDSLQTVFLLGNITHLGEALYAIKLCNDIGIGPYACTLWFIQTFCCGYPSLQYLLRMHGKVVKKLVAEKRNE